MKGFVHVDGALHFLRKRQMSSRRARHEPVRWESRSIIAATLLGLLLAVGGGGSPAPFSELLCQLFAAAALAAWAFAAEGSTARHDWRLMVVAGLIAIPPALQLIPLPPALWHALPGREAMRASLDLIGLGADWRAMSIDPARTLASLLSLIPPLLVMVMAARLAAPQRRLLIWVVAGMALLSVLVGAAQIAGGGSGFLSFYGSSDGILYGFQANRNAEVDVLLIGLLALAAGWVSLRDMRATPPFWLFVGLGAVLLLGAMLTASRAGIALALPALGAVAAIIRPPRLTAAKFTARRLLLAIASTLAPIALAAVLWRNAAIGRVAARFQIEGEFRPELWRDSLYAIEQNWPFGSGLGTFYPAFVPAERLEVIDNLLPNRAHNEFLELALEGGLPLLACWLVAALLVGFALWRALRTDHGAPREQALLALGILSVTLLHSLVDYPFRSMALASLIGLGAGMALGLGASRPKVVPRLV